MAVVVGGGGEVHSLTV